MAGADRSGRLVVWLVAIALAGGCVAYLSNVDTDERSTETGMTLDEAWCSDLEAGRDPASMMARQVATGYYDDAQQAANQAYVMTDEECPGELDSNAALRSYLADYGLSAR